MSKPVFQLSNQYGTVSEKNGIHTIRFERIVGHPVEKVWEAITVPEKIAQWLSSNIEKPGTSINLQLGGKIRLQYMMALPEGVITGLVNCQLLEITWSPQHITRWELFKEGRKKCRIVFTESLNEPLAMHGIVGYHAYLDLLIHVLDGGIVPADFLNEYATISRTTYEAYTELFTNHEPFK
jgi:uncharacterized protein YndB with AHSA1/START domain